ncbi:hypothetical protein D3C87_2053790 [compost metagenome]
MFDNVIGQFQDNAVKLKFDLAVEPAIHSFLVEIECNILVFIQLADQPLQGHD